MPPENKIVPEERQEAEYEFNDEQIFLGQAVSGACLARQAFDRLRDIAYEGGIDMHWRGWSIYATTSGRTDLSQNFEIPDETGTIDTNVIHLISCMFYVEQCPVLTQIKP